MSDERRLFLTNRYDAEKQQEGAAVENQLEKALRDGMKPSEFAEKSLTWLMTEGFITQEHWAELLCALDRMTEIPYSTGWERRSYRSADYSLYAFPIAELIRAFSMDFMMQYPVLVEMIFILILVILEQIIGLLHLIKKFLIIAKRLNHIVLEKVMLDLHILSFLCLLVIKKKLEKLMV